MKNAINRLLFQVKMAEIETSSQDLAASCEVLQSDSSCSEPDRQILNEAG